MTQAEYAVRGRDFLLDQFNMTAAKVDELVQSTGCSREEIEAAIYRGEGPCDGLPEPRVIYRLCCAMKLRYVAAMEAFGHRRQRTASQGVSSIRVFRTRKACTASDRVIVWAHGRGTMYEEFNTLTRDVTSSHGVEWLTGEGADLFVELVVPTATGVV